MPEHTTRDEDRALSALQDIPLIVNRLDEELSNKNSQIEDLDNTIKERDEKIEYLENNIADLRSEIAGLTAERVQ